MPSVNKKPLGLWIPPAIKGDERLTLLEKFILSTIIALCGKDGCFASNRYIADECGCKTTKVSHTIAKGVELGYITSEYDPGVQRIIRTPSHAGASPLAPPDSPPSHAPTTPSAPPDKAHSHAPTTPSAPPDKAPSHKQTPPDETLPSHIDIIKNNIDYTKKAGTNIPTLEEVKIFCREKGLAADPERFWNYYNSVGWMRGNTPVRDWRSLLAVWRDFDKEKMDKTACSFDGGSFDTEDFFQLALKKSYG